MANIGLSNFVYAILQSDDANGVAYSAPVSVPGIIQADIKPKTDSATLYADDGPVETATVLGEITVDINLTDLDLQTQAALLGHTLQGGVLVKKTSDIAPYVAIGFKAKKSNGKYRYYWLLKGRFEVPEQSHKTQEDKADFQTPKISGKFVKRLYDNAWQRMTDEDDPNYLPTVGENWFNAVESADTTPPSVSSVIPANNANNVNTSSVITWNFNEPIMASTVAPANFLVQKADGSAQVAGTLSLSADKKTVTFTPSANLAAATQYMAIVTTGVKDLFGNAMAAPSVTKFTTA